MIRHLARHVPTCLAKCTLNLATAAQGGLTDDVSICPCLLPLELHVEPPPVALILENTVHPFCVGNGYSLMRVFHVSSAPDRRVQTKTVCIVNATPQFGRQSRAISCTIFSTTSKAAIQCDQVVENAVLPRNWTGLCARVMLTGQMTVLNAQPKHSKQD